MYGFNAAHVPASADEPLNHAVRHEETNGAAGGRQNAAFGQVFAKQSPAVAAQYGANGKLSSPGGAAGHQKAGDIQTRNQKKAACRGKEHVQRRLDIPDNVIEQRPALRGFAYKWIIEVLIAEAAHDER